MPSLCELIQQNNAILNNILTELQNIDGGNDDVVTAINNLAECICCPDTTATMGVGFNVASVIGSTNTKWNINGTDSDAVDDVPTGWTIADLVADLNASDPLGGTWAANAAGDSVVLTSPDPGTYIHLKFVSLSPVVTIPFGSVTA